MTLACSQEGQLRALSKSVDSADTGMVDYQTLVEVLKQDQAPAVDTYIQSCQSRPWGVVKPRCVRWIDEGSSRPPELYLIQYSG